jgi:hypothetical protein
LNKNEKAFFIDSFSRHFAYLDDTRIAIYGTGEGTRAILDSNYANKIACVIDASSDDGEFCGKQIIPLDSAKKWGIEIVLIIARRGNIEIIYKRISDYCIANSIRVFDINGEELQTSGNDNDIKSTSEEIYEIMLSLGLWKRKPDKNISLYDKTYYFIAPIIYAFFAWMSQKANDLGIETILLGSRDGWIISRIYNAIKHLYKNVPKMEYFYVSRNASVLASLRNNADIISAASLAYSGGAADMLKHRFSLRDHEIKPQSNLEKDDYILSHADLILQKAAEARINYFRYIDSLHIQHGKKIGFFDFVSAGTSQKSLEKFAPFELHGLYFSNLSVSVDCKLDSSIDAMYGVWNPFKKGTLLHEKYFYLENILSSPEPALSGFDLKGDPIFLPEWRTSDIISSLNLSHKAIVNFCLESNLDLTQMLLADNELLGKLLELAYENIFSNSCDLITLEIVDEFCNRRFKL